jgi:hypothetical protein
MASDPFHISARELRGKQSVRATFRLPDEVIELLKTAAEHLGVKQKSLLDQLVDDRDVLSKVAAECRRLDRNGVTRRQKTFVLSRKALAMLDEISTSHNIARDLLLELSVGRLAPFVLAEQEKQRNREALTLDVDRFAKSGRKLLNKAETLLERDDLLRLKIEKMIGHAEKSIGDMASFFPAKKR